jgi:hypothetical protein
MDYSIQVVVAVVIVVAVVVVVVVIIVVVVVVIVVLLLVPEQIFAAIPIVNGKKESVPALHCAWTRCVTKLMLERFMGEMNVADICWQRQRNLLDRPPKEMCYFVGVEGKATQRYGCRYHRALRSDLATHSDGQSGERSIQLREE